MNNLWTDQQKAIFNEVKTGNKNIVVVARAGSGKSSTLIESLKYLPQKRSVLLLAFNTSIANHLKNVAPSYAEIKTSHAFGYMNLKTHFGKIKLNNGKMFNIFANLLKQQYGKINYDIIFSLLKCCSLCKNYLYDSPAKIIQLIEEFGIHIHQSLNQEQFIQLVIAGMSESKKDIKTIDFDDMVYLPFVHNIPIKQYEFVFVDETQDFNRAQIYMLMKSVTVNGRKMIVGDPNQMIYKFRGADEYNISKLFNDPNATKLPLSVSFRCAKNIIRLAQGLVPDIEYWKNSTDGKIHRISENEIINLVKPSDFIISRTNAPLIKYCIQLLELNKPVIINGKDLGDNLKSIVVSSRKKKITEFIIWLKAWRIKEIAGKSSMSKKVKHTEDMFDCLTTISIKCDTTTQALALIKKIFSEPNTSSVIVLSTTHRVKGNETDRCFVLMNTFVFGDTLEEKNIKYVAWTRAKQELFLVE